MAAKILYQLWVLHDDGTWHMVGFFPTTWWVNQKLGEMIGERARLNLPGYVDTKVIEVREEYP